MELKIRRVVTGHDEKGRAMVKIDETAPNVISWRAGQEQTVIWTTEGFPVDNTNESDGSTRKVATSDANGTVFRVVYYAPGVSPRNHRTDSIDYGVVIAGEIHMELDDGLVVALKAGDVLVQRGTIHNWVNKGTVPCVIAFTLIGAKPYTIDGKKLDAMG
ncbi:MAG: cupin domain-containing protein [Betaproteobacteria bacterium]|nr:cupin domain-containing protein [Betaproteobacteria bacterium]